MPTIAIETIMTLGPTLLVKINDHNVGSRPFCNIAKLFTHGKDQGVFLLQTGTSIIKGSQFSLLFTYEHEFCDWFEVIGSKYFTLVPTWQLILHSLNPGKRPLLFSDSFMMLSFYIFRWPNE